MHCHLPQIEVLRALSVVAKLAIQVGVGPHPILISSQLQLDTTELLTSEKETGKG